MTKPLSFSLVLALLVLSGCEGTQLQTAAVDSLGAERDSAQQLVPSWAADAVWYQIFPERFRSADSANDPIRASLQFVEVVPASWEVTPWTSDWYARAGWEREMGPDFYDHGVFHRRFGGDLQGVIEKLDYLRELGINAIYFNPVFYARSLHKYDANSFHHIEPYFGPDPEGDLALIEREDPLDSASWAWTSADLLFLDMIEAAAERGIRVIVDGVFNHTGRDFFAFADIRRNQADSRFADWYIVEQWDDPTTEASEFRYKGWWGIETLPEFAEVENDLHPGPKAYVFDATRRWMRPEVDGVMRRGIDGWRLDVANEVPIGFWAAWNELVRELNPEAYTVTELWQDAGEFLREGGFSATMNYHAFAFPVKGFLVDGTLSASDFARMLTDRRLKHTEEMGRALQNLIDSHDTERLASMIVNAERRVDYEAPDRFDYDWGDRVSPRRDSNYDVRKPGVRERRVQRLVALFQMTYVGAPMIYYGTEAGMWGADDPDDRKPMVWPDLAYESETSHPLGGSRPSDEVAFDVDLFDFYQEVIDLRHQEEALRRGAFDVLHTDDANDLMAFSRTSGSEAVVVILNRSDEAHSLRVALPDDLRGPYRMLFSISEEGHRVQQDETALLVEIPALSALVVKRDGQE